MLEYVFIALALVGVFLIVATALWSITTIRYHIKPCHLQISWLGLPLRRIRLDTIVSITHRSVFWAERWYNTLSAGNRMLVINRRRGLFRNLIITPRNQLVFKAELDRASKGELPPPAGPGNPDQPQDTPGVLPGKAGSP